MITSLKPNQIFVFGSNLAGEHVGGAAKQAYAQFGAIWGVGVGLAGQTYAIPTMHGLAAIVAYVDQFIDFAIHRPDLEFLVTPIGTGIAGHKAEDIALLFEDVPSNVILPEEFL